MNHYISINKQRGTSILEAIITLVLVAMISSGAVFLSARASESQGELRLQEIALSQLRAALISNGTNGADICATPPTITLTNNMTLSPPHEVQVQGCGETVTATINGVALTVQEPLRISVTHDLLGGQLVVGGAWDNI